MSSERKSVDVPFDFDKHAGQFGWIWHAEDERWYLCAVMRNQDDLEAVKLDVVRWWNDDDPAEGYEEVQPENMAGKPFIPLYGPACNPGAGLEIRAMMDGGSAISMAIPEPGSRADRVWEALRAIMMDRGEKP